MERSQHTEPRELCLSCADAGDDIAEGGLRVRAGLHKRLENMIEEASPRVSGAMEFDSADRSRGEGIVELFVLVIRRLGTLGHS